MRTRASSRRTPDRSASARSARDRRRGSGRTTTAVRLPSGARTRRCPPAARAPPRRRPRRPVSARGGAAPRAHAARSAAARARRSSARARRTRASGRRARACRGPPAPYAAETGGAGTPTPNVQTPETTCESAEMARQRTVYVPTLSGRTLAISRLPCTADAPAKSRPTPFSTRTAPGSTFTC